MNHSFLKFSILSLLGVLLTFGCAKNGKVGTVSKKDPMDQRAQPEMKKVEFEGGLEKALNVAQTQYQSAKIEVFAFSDAIRSLRAEIRKLKQVPQSQHYTINRFPSEPLF